MDFNKHRKGPYICFSPVENFSAGQIVKLKTVLTDDLKDNKSDFAFDLSNLDSIDVTGLRFLKNLKTLFEY